MAKPYFTLITRDNDSAPWCIEFGAYDKSDVASELLEWRDKGILRRHLRILRTPNDRQATILAAVAELNAQLRLTAAAVADKEKTKLAPENTVSEFVPPAFAIVNSLTGEVIDTVPAGYQPRRDVCRNTLHAVDAAKLAPRVLQYRVDAKPFANKLQAKMAGAAFVKTHAGAGYSVRHYRNEGFFVVVTLPAGTLSHGWLSAETKGRAPR